LRGADRARPGQHRRRHRAPELPHHPRRAGVRPGARIRSRRQGMGGGAPGTLVAAQAALRRHAMPFGAEVLGDGGVRFRLWAPGAKQVDLILEDEARPMVPREGGWYETTEKARPGALYRYRIDRSHDVPDPA